MILIIQLIQRRIINQTMNKEFILKDFLNSFMQILNKILQEMNF